MIILVDNKSLGYKIGLGDKEGDIIQDFIDLFIEKYSIEYYNKADLVLVRNEIYYFIIKNIFGGLRGGLLSDEIPPLINHTLSL